ncbi:hypothetical protein [uncultured Polaribacter sp.]|uniref:hypothetical protein n=1 Tax=uncultured Polaribacter sp. TaxID=174711 RepID=UPI00263827A1|nr:hypothetical protein [uncultured Polaribacter sp.]
MEVEKDFIKREIQKLLLLLNSLIGKISGINSNNAESEIGDINEALKNEFDLSLVRIAKMENSELIEHISKLHESHAEKILELIYEIILKTESVNFGEDFEKTEIIQKGIMIIDYINEKTKIFSIGRMNMGNYLKQSL